MKKLRRAIGSFKNLTKVTGDEDERPRTLEREPTTSKLSPFHISSSYSQKEHSYVSYGNNSLGSYNGSITAREGSHGDTQSHNSTKLHKAAEAGDVSKAKKALKKSDINAKDGRGRTALHVAAANGHTGIILLLIGCGVDLEVEDSDGLTPFLTAVKSNQTRATHLLLQSKVNVDATDNFDNSAIHIASKNGSSDMLEMLIDCDLDCNACNALGRFPLHIAATELNLETVKTLIQHGIDIDCTDKEQITPLMLAAKGGSNSLVEFLISEGANPALVDRTQWNAAAYAKYNNHINLSNRLQNSTDDNVTEGNQRTLFGFGGSSSAVQDNGSKYNHARASSDVSSDSWNDDSENSTQNKDILAMSSVFKVTDENESDDEVCMTNEKILSTSNVSLGPPKPPRSYTSTPNLNESIDLSASSASLNIQSTESSGEEDKSNKSYPESVNMNVEQTVQKSFKPLDSATKDKEDSILNVEIEEDSDVDFDDSEHGALLVEENEKTLLKQTVKETGIISHESHSINSTYNTNAKEELQMPNIARNEKKDISSLDHDISTEKEENKHDKTSPSENNIDAIEGTLGRQGTLQEMEEIWEYNAKIEADVDSPSENSSSKSLSHRSDKNLHQDLKKVFFGDSRENVCADNEIMKSPIGKNEPNDIDVDSVKASEQSSKETGLSTKDSCSILSNDSIEGDTDEDSSISESCPLDPGKLMNEASQDNLVSLVRELRISLNRETARRKSSNRKVSLMKKIESDLKQQLREAETSAFQHQENSSSMGSKLAQLEYEASGSLDDSNFARSSLEEANRLIQELQLEKQTLKSQILSIELTLRELRDEDDTNVQKNLTLQEEMNKLLSRKSASVCIQTDNLQVSTGVQATDNSMEFLPNSVKNSISSTLTQVEGFVCDASTQIEKMIGDESLPMSNAMTKSTQTVKTTTSSIDHETQTELELYQQHGPVLEALNAATQTECEYDSSPEVFSANTENQQLVSLLRSLMKDSTEDLKNICNNSVKEALKEKKVEENLWSNASLLGNEKNEELINNIQNLPKDVCDSIIANVGKIFPNEDIALKSDLMELNSKLNILQDIFDVIQVIKEKTTNDSASSSKYLNENDMNSSLLTKLNEDIQSLHKDFAAISESQFSDEKENFLNKFQDTEGLLNIISNKLDENKTTLSIVSGKLNESCNKSIFLSENSKNYEQMKNLSSEISELKRAVSSDDHLSKDFMNQVKCNLEESQVSLSQSINGTIKQLLGNMDETVEENFQIVQNFLQNIHQSLTEKVNDMRMDKVQEVEKSYELLKSLETSSEEMKKAISDLKISINVCQEFHSKPALDETFVGALHESTNQNLGSIQSQNQTILQHLTRFDSQLKNVNTKQEELESAFKNFKLNGHMENIMTPQVGQEHLGKEVSSLKDQYNELFTSMKNLLESMNSERKSDTQNQLLASNNQTMSFIQENANLKSLIDSYKSEIQDLKHWISLIDTKTNHNEVQATKAATIATIPELNFEKTNRRDLNDITGPKIEATVEDISSDMHRECLKDQKTLNESLEMGLTRVDILKREKKQLENEIKDKTRTIKGLHNQIVDLESDQSELEGELNMKTSQIILLKKEASKHARKVKESKDQIDDCINIKSLNLKLEQKCREFEIEIDSKKTLIESLKSQLNALTVEKLHMLHEVSSLRENKISYQILIKEKEMAEESVRNMEKELKEVYEKLSLEYFPKSKIDSFYSQIESHFQFVMSNKLKELNELLENKFRDQDYSKQERETTTATNPNQTLESEVKKLTEEMRDLRSGLKDHEKDTNLWKNHYNILHNRYQNLLVNKEQPIPANYSLETEYNNPSLDETIQDINHYIKKPYPNSKFLDELCSSSASPSLWNSFNATGGKIPILDSTRSLQQETSYLCPSETTLDNRNMKPERDSGIGSFLARPKDDFLTNTNDPSQTDQSYVDMLKKKYG